jgi:transcriptional regulator with XRE-family HTH domain
MNMSKKLEQLRREGMTHEGFREGYDARDGLIRLGDMLRRAREASGLTQEMLASKIGMAQPAISRLESGFGPHGPEMDTVMRFVHGCEAELVVSVKTKTSSEQRQHDVAAMAFETLL